MNGKVLHIDYQQPQKMSPIDIGRRMVVMDLEFHPEGTILGILILNQTFQASSPFIALITKITRPFFATPITHHNDYRIIPKCVNLSNVREFTMDCVIV
jgi:hypothetical protein